jgi:hypothetical protein
MDILENFEGFDWDEGNVHKSVDRHGISRAEAEQVFIDPRLLISDDVAHSVSEARYHALGRTQGGRLLHVTFALRKNGTLIRVISARDINRKERNRYEDEA